MFNNISSSKTYLLGLCTGMLPAAALAVSTSTSQLLDLAPEIVRVSLRLGLAASRRSAQVERSCESWATVVPHVAPQEQQEILDQFHREHVSNLVKPVCDSMLIKFFEKVIPTSKKAYISAESDSTVTISGPPSTLATLFSSSGPLKDARKINLPITAAFHAPHLGDLDVDKIIGSSSNFINYHLRKDTAIISTSSGEPISAHNLGEALQQIILDILQEPLRWSTVVHKLVTCFRGQNAVLISAGPVRAADSVRREMNNAGIDVDRSEIQPLPASHTRNLSSDIAIVGMAGRLPGCETLEEIWKVLEDGRDVHKKVSLTCQRCAQRLIFDRFRRTDLTWTLIAIRLESSKTRQ